jgi:predicted RNA-binding protein with PUA-like domain
MRYWLLKSEPESFAVQHLADSPGQTTCWDGVRNYQARNFMRDEMRVGDRVLYYHSGKAPAVAGTATVVRSAYPDPTAWDRDNDHYDPTSTAENPVWVMVDIRLDRVFARPIPLGELRGVPALAGMELLRRGSRLSVQPVTKAEFDTVLKLAVGARSRKTP